MNKAILIGSVVILVITATVIIAGDRGDAGSGVPKECHGADGITVPESGHMTDGLAVDSDEINNGRTNMVQGGQGGSVDSVANGGMSVSNQNAEGHNVGNGLAIAGRGGGNSGHGSPVANVDCKPLKLLVSNEDVHGAAAGHETDGLVTTHDKGNALASEGGRVSSGLASVDQEGGNSINAPMIAGTDGGITDPCPSNIGEGKVN